MKFLLIKWQLMLIDYIYKLFGAPRVYVEFTKEEKLELINSFAITNTYKVLKQGLAREINKYYKHAVYASNINELSYIRGKIEGMQQIILLVEKSKELLPPEQQAIKRERQKKEPVWKRALYR